MLKGFTFPKTSKEHLKTQSLNPQSLRRKQTLNPKHPETLPTKPAAGAPDLSAYFVRVQGSGLGAGLRAQGFGLRVSGVGVGSEPQFATLRSLEVVLVLARPEIRQERLNIPDKVPRRIFESKTISGPCLAVATTDTTSWVWGLGV